MSIHCYKLNFTAPLHVASGGFKDEATNEFIHSDTLWSAICSMASRIFSSQEIKPLFEAENMVFSSCFPFFQDTLFFPKPHAFFPSSSEVEINFKLFKKVKFVTENHLREICTGNHPPFRETDVAGSFWHDDANYPETIFKRTDIVRTATDRIIQTSQVFTFSQIHFHPKAGLFFLATFKNDDIKTLVETTLQFLADEGFGSDRTAGKGLFEYNAPTDFNFNVNNPSKRVLLSLYNPQPKEIDKISWNESHYNITTRRGWVHALALRRQALRMLTEGSTLATNHALIGSVQTVLDAATASLPYKIFRNGQAFSLPYKG